ncbi:MAG TPA: type II secretion system protein GspI [Gammaproteobacteria bacterium]|nr:type II secretion system protein GspI [Gammaproteobacteria bacterium]
MTFRTFKSRCLILNKSKGFTLLEVIVALGIVSVGILAVSQAMVSHVGSVATVEQRMTGFWVASNRFETLRIQKTEPAVGEVTGSEQMAGRTWYYRESTEKTADPALFMVNVSVYLDEAGDEEAGSLFGYLLKP